MPTVSSYSKNLVNKPKIYVLIVAAGKGSRFAATIAKQYLLMDDKTIVQHSVAKLAQSDYIDSHLDLCHLVIAKDDDIARTLSWDMSMKYVIGGAERWNSVQAGVSSIARLAEPNDLVLIHDAARPCVQVDDINRVISVAMQEEYGAILATPVADTLKKVGESSYSIQTIDRQGIWQAQTPQVFRLTHLQTVLSHVQDSNIHITDEASGFEQLGYPIKMVSGSRLNMKLTYPEDLALLQSIVHMQGGGLESPMKACQVSEVSDGK